MHAFDVLGDPVRRRIIELLGDGEGEQPAGAIAEAIGREFGISQPAVSQHLKVLRESLLVRAEPKGASNVYHIDPAGLGQMRAWLDRFWSSTLAAYKVAVEKSVEDQQ